MNPIIFQAKAALNTFIRLVPIGLYFGTLIMGILFSDIRAFVLFIGYLLNDIISFGFRQLFQTVDIPNCAIVQSNRNFYTLPSSHTQTIAFTLAYFFTDMYMNQNFNIVNFIFLGFLLIITMWSRINVGCESIVDGIFATILGILIGVAFYRLTQSWNEIGQPPDTTTNQQSKTSQVQIFQR
jgi:membrane-associated phospholipid phosphatase